LQWARNCGLAQAQGCIVAYTDDDVVPDSEWLLALTRTFLAFPEVVCVTGLVAPRELETPAQVWFEQYGGLGLGYTRRLFNLGGHRPHNPFFPYTGMCAVGANLAVRTAVCRDVGGFDPALDVGTPALGGGDLELCFRLVTRGYTLAYEPSALVWHMHRRDYTALRRQIFAYGAGFTAYLTRCLAANPYRIIRFAAVVPYGVYLMLHPRSVHNHKKAHDFPRELSWLERLGLIYGPFAYLRSKFWTARLLNGAVARRK
jgi:GT2 family glycosyltransferase